MRSPRFQSKTTDRRNRRQGLAAKTESRNIQQVFGILDFRRRMALEGQQSVVTHHAATVVGDLDELLAPSLDLNLDARGTSIQSVLQQFLHHGCRALDNLPGGDLVSDVLGKDVN